MWPHNPDISTRAWVRYFSSVPQSVWQNTIIIQSFLTSVDALRVLKAKLLKDSPVTWDNMKMSLVEQADATWITEEQRALVKSVLQ